MRSPAQLCSVAYRKIHGLLWPWLHGAALVCICWFHPLPLLNPLFTKHHTALCSVSLPPKESLPAYPFPGRHLNLPPPIYPVTFTSLYCLTLPGF
jgi:hypothetical protein